ncbi:MAG: hydrogenase expression/formation protein HypE [Clostridia bacterium]|nr:hydrogenase expression/formation protein HypE [Clostridia bacterium]
MSEIIKLAQGSGGFETSRLISEIFSEKLGNEYLNRGEDAAVLDVSGKIAYSTDSFVVEPIIFPGGDIGKLSVCGTVNDLAMMGARPMYLTIGFILEEGLCVDTLREIVSSIAECAKEAQVKIVAADTKVVPGNGGMYINTSGIGIIPDGRDCRTENIKDGDKILISRSIGDHHAAIMSARMGIENDIKSDVNPVNHQVEALFEAGVNIRVMRDVTRGGLGTVLNELSEKSSVGMVLCEEDIPVAPTTASLCKILGLDIFYMGNEGTFIAIIPSEDADVALGTLPNARIIGECSGGKVIVKNSFGGERVLPVLYGEGLPRIC